MKPIALAFLALTITFSVQAQNIYNSEIPEVHFLWSRLADYSPLLRSVEAVEISPDGKSVISGSKYGYNLMHWRVADGALLWEKQLPAEIECVAYSPDGKYVVSGDENYFVTIWNAETGEEIKAIESDSGFDGITWSNTGKYLAGGAENGDLYLWDTKNFELTKRINTGSTINSLQFTANDKQILVGGNIQTPDPESGQTIYTGFAKLINVETGKLIREFGTHSASVKSVRMTDDETLVATASFANEVKVFEFKTGEEIITMEQPLRMEAVAFTPDGLFLACGGHEKAVRFYRTRDWKMVLSVPTPRTEYIDFSEDGRLMVTGHEDSGLIQLYIFLSDTQHRQDVYQKISNQQLNNRDLKK